MAPEAATVPDLANVPIPSYEEAIASDFTLSGTERRRQENAAQHEGLLASSASSPNGYQRPTVESARSSLDSDLGLPEVTSNRDESRRVMEEFDYMDPDLDTSRRSPRPYHHSARLRHKFSQRWSNLSATLSSIRLPSIRSLYTPLPSRSNHDAVPDRPYSRFARVSEAFRGIRVPEHYRMSAPTFARLCGLLSIVLLIYFLFAWDLVPGRTGHYSGARYDPESIRTFIQDNINVENIKAQLQHITSYDHVAGTQGDLFMAEWMQEHWTSWGNMDSVALLPYHVYLNYPVSHTVSITSPSEKVWTAKLEEDAVYPDRQQTLVFHGHSKDGVAEGPLIYANGGARADFAHLKDHGVLTNGSIALVKYFGTQGDRALKVKAAEEAGCIGILIYSDPSDTDSQDAWQPPDDMVQRGAVSLMSWIVGDPLTPGYASTLEADRKSKDNNPGLPKIPSLPLAWRDAQVLLKSLNGHGLKVPNSWVYGDPHSPKEWYSGNSSSSRGDQSPIVRLENHMEDNPLQKIWNLHGLIEGAETPDKKIIVGNHRDSWCFGSVDPGSGTAIMLEVVRIFGQLRAAGWRPLRTIEFASWDAEEYNLVGSTEYVEDKIDYLRQNAVAYINVDAAVAGRDFKVNGAPLWERAIRRVMDRVGDPSSNGTATLLKTWHDASRRIGGLGAGSDYVAFQDIAGTSSIDFGFEGNLGNLPYHSCHETFEWMMVFGDPEMQYHRALAQVWALLILEMADSPLIPYNLRDYADRIKEYIQTLERDAAGAFAAQQKRPTASSKDLEAATGFTIRPLMDAADVLTNNAEKFHQWEDYWTSHVLAAGGFENREFGAERIAFNDRLARFDTDLLDERGIPGREQFKHVIFGPQLWSGYDEAYFPGVRDMIEAGDWVHAQEMLGRAAARIRIAAENLLN